MIKEYLSSDSLSLNKPGAIENAVRFNELKKLALEMSNTIE